MQAVRNVVWLVALLGMTAGLSAQSMTVNPAQPHVGAPVQVTYSNPSLAGQTVVIVVDDGNRLDGEVAYIQLQLDSDGNGQANWTCPNWPMLKFNAPEVAELLRMVTGWDPTDGPPEQ